MAEGNAPGGAMGRRRERLSYPKGRQIDPAALDEIRALLGPAPRRRDLLIEYLHLVQDRYHGLTLRHLAALADDMRLPFAEVYEVASFYAHFDIVRDGEAMPPALTVRVCDSITCEMLGARRLIDDLSKRLGPQVRVVAAPCMGRCESAPVVAIGHRQVDHADGAKVAAMVAAGDTAPVIPDYVGLDAYRTQGGYAVLTECRNGTRTREAVIAALEASGLRGLGGAGFPAARKWRTVIAEPGPRLMAVNADEGEPGTIKDRYYLERDPHRAIEGMLIGAWAVEARTVYFYLRDEYPAIREILLREFAALKEAGLDGGVEIELRRGAGAYICGEESAMLESIEGKRGLPRHKPPYPAQVGLFGRPTLIHNVETLYWMRDILARGPEWFGNAGRNGRKGWRSFSVSGRVKQPGVKLTPAGISVRELIDEYCGGMQDGHTLAAYLPGGASGGILPASLDHIPLDFGTLEPFGALIGSAAVVVLSDQDDVRAAALNLMRFFADESCGQCTPCRVGTEKMQALMEQKVWDEAMMTELGTAMRDASICGLGQAAPNPVLSVLRFFAVPGRP
jgi:formate dehydrogenase beta subunit